MQLRYVLSASMGFVLLSAAVAQERINEVADQAAIGLTLYQDGLGLVRDERTVDLTPGEANVLFVGISDRVVPGSVTLRGQGDLEVSGLALKSANLDSEALMRSYLGEAVTLVREHPQTGERIEAQGVLLSAGPAPLVQIGDQVEVLDQRSPWRLRFDRVPAGLTARPGLEANFSTETRGPQSIELSYLTQGLSWQADYVLQVDDLSGSADLSSWFSLRNETGTGFQNADVQLVAGSPHRVQEPRPMPMLKESMARDAIVGAQSLGDYRLYALPAPVTLDAGETQQVRWLERDDIAVDRSYRVRGYALAEPVDPEPAPVETQLVLEDALDRPLPAGVVRVYGNDAQGRSQFLGEDAIDDVPSGEPVEVTLGQALDVRAQRTLRDLQRTPQHTTVSWRIDLTNTKDEPVTVAVEEIMPGDWRIISESTPHQRPNATLARWQVEVPAQGSAALEYQAEVSTPR